MPKISIWLWWFYYFNFSLEEQLEYLKQYNWINWVELHLKHWYKFNDNDKTLLKNYKYNTLHLHWYSPEDDEWIRYCVENIPNFQHFVLHPDNIDLDSINPELIKYISFENMDIRKCCYKQADEMNNLFKKFPQAKFTLDINHLEENDIKIEDFDVEKKPSQIHFSALNKWYYDKYNIETPHALACLEKWYYFDLKPYKDCIITTEWVYLPQKPELIQQEIDLINKLLS